MIKWREEIRAINCCRNIQEIDLVLFGIRITSSWLNHKGSPLPAKRSFMQDQMTALQNLLEKQTAINCGFNK
jgi:hypothetical protein